MSEMNRTNTYAADGLQAYLTRVFTKMGLGLLVTALVAGIGYYTNFYYNFIMATGSFGYLLLVIAQFGVVMSISGRLTTLRPQTANLLFFVYAALTGFTFSTLFYAYDIGTLFGAFGFSALMFICCAIIGHTTNVDLSKFSSLIFGALIALVLATVVSSFIPALQGSLALTYIGIILFLVLTAWDMQRIKTMYYQTSGYGEIGENLAVYGALELYLDFINIFLYVLRIFGSRSSRD